LDYLLKNERPIPEVEESLANFEDLYKKLVEKHDEYIQLVDGDEEFATEEERIENCQQRFMQIRIREKDYLKINSQGQFENEKKPEIGLVPNQTDTTVSDNGQQEHDGIPGSCQGPSHQGQPNSTKVKAHPTKVNSHPTKVNFLPTKVNPHPTKVNSHPTKVNPPPTKLNPHPTKVNPHPSKVNPQPTKDNPHPTKVKNTIVQFQVRVPKVFQM
jgi:hypothetical protein